MKGRCLHLPFLVVLSMVFKSRIDWTYKLSLSFIFLVGIIGAIGIYFDQKEATFIPSLSFFCFILVLNLLMYILALKTDYTFTEDTLKCRSWIFKKNIKFKDIVKIEPGTTFYAGWKLATARNGIIITYKDYSDVYISPERQEEFISLLLEKNPSIRKNQID